MKLFALGRIVSAGSVYIGLAGEVAKFTEMAIITLRILSSVGDAWRPPGHPRRFSPAVATDQSPLFFVVVVVVLVVDVVACVIDVVWPFWSLSLVCLLLSLFHGQIIRASTRICDPSYFKLLHFWALIIFQSSRVTEPTHPPVFIAPPHSTISKNVVFIHKQALFTDFRQFFCS